MKGDTSFSILSKEEGIHFIHEKKKLPQVDVHDHVKLSSARESSHWKRGGEQWKSEV